MQDELRKSGIDIIGNVPWATHFCQFYQGKEDMLSILVPYFKAGLENNEACMWVTSEPLSVEEARRALAQAVPDLEARTANGQLEIVPHTEWYLKNPAVSFVLSWLVPGVGQMYNGQTGKGILQLAGAIVGYTLFIVEIPREEEVWVYNYYDTYDYGYWEWQDKGNAAIAWTGFAVGFGMHVWSMIDAPLTASRMNREGGLSFNEIKLSKNLKIAYSPVDFQKRTVGPNIKMQLNF